MYLTAFKSEVRAEVRAVLRNLRAVLLCDLHECVILISDLLHVVYVDIVANNDFPIRRSSSSGAGAAAAACRDADAECRRSRPRSSMQQPGLQAAPYQYSPPRNDHASRGPMIIIPLFSRHDH